MAAQRLRDVGVPSTEPIGRVPLDGVGHPFAVTAHDAVVQHDRQDWDAAAYGGLEVHPDHAESSVPHDVDREPIGPCEPRPHREAQARAELRRFPPAEIPARDHALVERHDLVSRVPGVVSHHRACTVRDLHQLPHDAVGAERRRLGGESRKPLLHESGANGRHVIHHRRASGKLRRVDAGEGFEQLPQDELGIAYAAEADVVAGREIAWIGHDLPERCVSRHRRDVQRAREARADTEDQVCPFEETIHCRGPGASGRA